MNQRRSLRALVVFLALLTLIIPATSGAASPPQVRCQSEANPVGDAPPPGFTPLTATPEELQCYGFPPRPANPQARTGWESAMAHALQRVTPHFVTVPISAGVIGQAQNSPGQAGWAGYYANVSDQGISGLHWQDIYSHWYVAAANNTDNAHPLLTWVGYGGAPQSNPNYLIQAGTWTCGGSPCIPAGGTARMPQYTFWYENWPQQSAQADTFNSLHIAPGDDFYQDVYNVSSTSTQFFFEDLTRNLYTGFTQSGEQTNTNSSAEWIFEDPTTTPYAFSTNKFFHAGASGLNGIGSNAFQNFRIINIFMQNYANPAATIDTTNNGFHICYGVSNQC